MNMQVIGMVLLFCATSVAQDLVRDKDGTTASLFRDIEAMLNDEQDDIVDFEKLDEVASKVLKIFDEHGIDSSFLFENDADFLKVLGSMIFGGRTKTSYSPYMLSFQLNCYQGIDKGVFGTVTHVNSRYNNYGCHCGAGFSNGTPVDETDRCCKIHDECYVTAMRRFNLEFGCDTYKTAYKATCCKEEKRTICGNGGPSAERDLCECDQEMGKCVRSPKALSAYRSSNKNIRKRCKDSEKVPGIASLLLTCFRVRRRRTINGRLSRRRYGAGGPACVSSRRRRRRRRLW